MDKSQCSYFNPFCVAWLIGEQSYANFGIVIAGLPWAVCLVRSASLGQGQGYADLVVFSNSNELKGTWSILYSESQLKRT